MNKYNPDIHNWDEHIEHYPPKTTWKDVVALTIGCTITTALLLAVVIIGH